MSVRLLKYFTIITFFCFTVSSFAFTKPILPIQQWKTQSGTPVFFVQVKELPMVDIQVVFDAGSARDYDKPGIAKMTSEAISSGTPTKNAYQIAAAFDDIGARFSTAVNRDMAIVAMKSLSDAQVLKTSFNTFLDVLAHASFPENEVKRIQKQTLNVIEEQNQLPASIAAKAFYKAIYNGNPYGHPIFGNHQSVSHLAPADLKTFFRSFYTAQNAMITIVGDVSNEQAKNIAETLTSQLNKGVKLKPPVFNPFFQKQLAQHITFPSSQTHVLIGQTGISRNDPNYFPILIGNYVLGGGTLTSRLFDGVREKRGLAYTVRSQFNALKEKGPFIIELQTRNSEARNAINVVNDILSNFIKLGPSAQELIAAKKNLTQGFILKLASNSAIMAQLTNIGYYQLPLNYLDTYKEKINSITNEDIKAVFQRIIKPSNLITVTVGNNSVAQNGKTNLH